MASSSTLSVEDLLGSFHSRRLLPTPCLRLDGRGSATGQRGRTGPDDRGGGGVANAFDANVVMVLCSNLVVATGEQQRSGGGDPSARLANTGIKKKALKTFPTISYTNEVKLPGLDSECVICLSEFSPGERVQVGVDNSAAGLHTVFDIHVDIPVEVNWSTAFSTVIKAQSVESESYVMAEEILVQTGPEAALGDEGDNILPTSPPPPPHPRVVQDPRNPTHPPDPPAEEERTDPI
nr:RING-H2 finger protein ATL78-like [Ipomoea batatas]